MVIKKGFKGWNRALLCAAQEQTIRTNYIKYHIDKTSDSPMCRLCGKKGESVQHRTSGCEKLAQKEYKRRHDNLQKKFIGMFVKRPGQNTVKSGMSMLRKEQ